MLPGFSIICYYGESGVFSRIPINYFIMANFFFFFLEVIKVVNENFYKRAKAVFMFSTRGMRKLGKWRHRELELCKAPTRIMNRKSCDTFTTMIWRKTSHDLKTYWVENGELGSIWEDDGFLVILKQPSNFSVARLKLWIHDDRYRLRRGKRACAFSTCTDYGWRGHVEGEAKQLIPPFFWKF